MHDKNGQLELNRSLAATTPAGVSGAGAMGFVPSTSSVRARHDRVHSPSADRESATVPNLAAVKARQKAIWESGDFGQIARTIEPVAEEFMGRQSFPPDARVKSVLLNLLSLASGRSLAKVAALVALAAAPNLRADETCSSPYLARIEGQEEFVYVWTLGAEGVGDGSDKLVTIDVKPGSTNYGKVIHSHSLGGRHEAHHGGFTDDRRQLWLSGLERSRVFIFDVHTDPSDPRFVKTIDNFESITGGAVGPHGVYALPGRVLIPCLSNAKDRGGRTALVEFSNEGDYIATHWLPTKDTPGIVGAEFADGYGYDARVLPRMNVLLTTSFVGWKNYTRDFGDLMKDAEAMKQFGNSMILWNFHTRQPKQAFHVPGAPLEIRWAWGEAHNYAFTATALGSKLWLCYEDEGGQWQAKEVAQVGPAGGVLPVDISLSADDRTLFVDCFADGRVRVFDVSNPHQPKLTYEQVIGRQLNMVSQSWDGRRLYFSSSLLAHWDKTGDDNDQFVRAFQWDGQNLKPAFQLDFNALKLGRPHHMLFGSTKVGG